MAKDVKPLVMCCMAKKMGVRGDHKEGLGWRKRRHRRGSEEKAHI